MRNQLSTITLLLLASCAITGCSKSDSATPPSAPVVAPQAAVPAPKKLDNLALFNGKAPDGLVADATIGQSIRSVVPQAQFKCMSETFNYMPDLVLEGDGSLQATLSGSRAENWLMAYLNVSPSGLIDVVLRCPAEQQQMADAPFLYFTNRKLTDPTPKAVQDWFYAVGQESDLIKVSDSQVTNDIKFPEFMKGMLATAPNPKPIVPVTLPPAPAQVAQGGRIVEAAVNTPVNQSSAPPEITPSTSQVTALIGNWDCGAEQWQFFKGRDVLQQDIAASRSGHYKVEGQDIEIRIGMVTDPIGRTRYVDAVQNMTIEKLTANELYFKRKDIGIKCTKDRSSSTNDGSVAPVAKSSVEIEACERGKERCYEKSGAMVGICLNALRSAKGC